MKEEMEEEQSQQMTEDQENDMQIANYEQSL